MSARNQDLQANYDALMALPLVQQILKQNKKLLKKNKKLSKRNKCLENLIYSLPEFRKNCCCCGPSRDVVRRAEQVHIKVEPGCEIETEDEVVRIINLNTPVKQNIQYEIVEAEEEEVEAEEEEVEAEEEEVEAEEEEAEAEEEEAEAEAEEEEVEAEEEEAEEEEAEEEEAEKEIFVLIILFHQQGFFLHY